MDLCLQGELFDELRNIASEISLSQTTNPQVASRFAEYFLQHEQYDKAVTMLINARQHDHALDLCMSYGVPITSEMAEKLTPPKSDNPADQDFRVQIVMKLAKCLRQQKSYQLACKKYTQAGDRIKATKCLIKNGDFKKVIYYASKTRQREVLILAANYLQNLDWHNNPEIMKGIINFYNHAKAHVQLAYFYDGCASIEIDEYRDYEKALRALKQGVKQLRKNNSMAETLDSNHEEKLDMMSKKVELVEKFVYARKQVRLNGHVMLQTCEELLTDPDLESALRVGDVYALMIEYHNENGNMSEAYNLIERMRESEIILGPYLDKAMVERVFSSMGVDLSVLENDLDSEPQDDDEIDEDIIQDES